MTEISRRSVFMVIGILPFLSGCASSDASDSPMTPESLLEEYFYRQMTIDLDDVRETNKNISERITGDFSGSEGFYKNLNTLSDSDLSVIIESFSSSDRSFILYDLSGLSKGDAAFLSTVSAIIASEISHSLGSEGSLSIDRKGLKMDGSDFTFPLTDLTMSSTKTGSDEMRSVIDSVYPASLRLIQNTDGVWKIDGKLFVENMRELLEDS